MDALLRRRAMIASGGGSPTPPLPYTPVEYIVTDGSCFISVRKFGTPPRSSEIKVLMGSNTACSLLAGYVSPSGGNGKTFALARYYSSGKSAAFSYYNNYGPADGMPSVEYSVDNNLPFIVKTDIKKGSQHISVKQENSNEWTTVSKTSTNNVSSTYNLRIFCSYFGTEDGNFAPAGTRLYYCKVWSDETYNTLIFDGVPCIYNGEYGLWDNVSNAFFGNLGNGTLSGPSNS